MAHDDVRMRGFRERISLEEALRRVLDAVSPLGPPEEVPLAEALGRPLVEDAVAPRPVPPFDRAAMDGYAVRADATFPATTYDPVAFAVAGEALPGAPWEGTLGEGKAVRIMTGAPLPAGADAVVPAEGAEESRGRVRITTPVSPGKNVGRAGEDVAEGTVAVPAGRALRPQDLGLLASLGLAKVRVPPVPSVALLVTGDEIVKAGAPIKAAEIYDANTPMLEGLVARWGGRVVQALREPDDRPRVLRFIGRLLANPRAHALLVSGGSSVGSEDHAPGIVAEMGRVLFHGVALRPAGPTGFGIVDGKPVFLLPGNPVSCLCAFDLLAGPAIRRMGGHGERGPYARVRLPLAGRLASVAGRSDYARVAIRDGRVEPVAVSGASILSSTVKADGFVLVPPEVEGHDAGETVEVHLYG